MTFNITLEATEEDPLFLQIATRVRTAITVGHLLPGARLPSSRALAAQLAIARGTVDAAYARVAGGGGGRVEAAEQPPLLFPRAADAGADGPRPFQMGLPALDVFPRKLWS